jgi:hypothetical protein
MTDTTTMTPLPVKTQRSRLRPHSLSAQLRAYADVVIGNLEANASTPATKRLRGEIQNALEEFRAHDRDELSLFLAIKGFEYQAVNELHFDTRQLAFFLVRDLQQTPATTDDIAKLQKCFLPPDLDETKAAPAVTPDVLAKVTHVAIGYWRQYAEMLLKAVAREKYIAVALAMTLLIYFGPIFATALNELFGGPERFIQFITSTPQIGFLSLGCAGAIVSLSLSGRNIAIAANRPLDNLYVFWSSVPRIMIGALAGTLAAQTVVLFSPFSGIPGDPNPDRAIAMQVLQMFLAFSGGFADRLFFEKLVDATWRVSGLTDNNDRKG